jgi:hypothetical protein
MPEPTALSALAKPAAIGGGIDLDAPHVAQLIAQSPLCLDCLVKKTGLSLPQTQQAIERIQDLLVVTVARGDCEGCLLVTTTHRLGRPEGSTTAPSTITSTDLPDLTQAVWRFLSEHRGQMFCSQCLAAAIGTTRRLDRALTVAEGRWARRHHGRCSRCSKDRLICGLAAL